MPPEGGSLEGFGAVQRDLVSWSPGWISHQLLKLITTSKVQLDLLAPMDEKKGWEREGRSMHMSTPIQPLSLRLLRAKLGVKTMLNWLGL